VPRKLKSWKKEFIIRFLEWGTNFAKIGEGIIGILTLNLWDSDLEIYYAMYVVGNLYWKWIEKEEENER